MKVFLGGEGTTELGRFAYEAAYQSVGDRGVLQVIVEALGAEVIGGIPWCRIRKVRAGAHATAEARNVAGLVLVAKERGADAVVFIRDRDRDVQRQRDVEQGILDAQRCFPTVRIAGGCAVEAIEALGLVLLGDVRAETYAKPKDTFAARGYGTVDSFCSLIEQNNPASLFSSTHARLWFERVKHVCAADRSFLE